MDLSGLERLGKVAGIAGVSIGAVVLLLNALIGTIPGLQADQQVGIIKLLAILRFGIGVIGIIAWVATSRSLRDNNPTVRSPGSVTNITANHRGMAAGRDNIKGARPS